MACILYMGVLTLLLIILLDCTVCVSVLLESIDPFSCEFYYVQRRIGPASIP